ncbi:hypothetical protein E3N88_34446 [Mikania micrantha]|uniref:Uncharacterized protein n=1 Tax=Mikania micrantha TaxID=192012 RepID=A0A5N6LZ11_9ASTR|nr:hypothetical protein E3N88_34446 [Mikania micrantha]
MVMFPGTRPCHICTSESENLLTWPYGIKARLGRTRKAWLEELPHVLTCVDPDHEHRGEGKSGSRFLVCYTDKHISVSVLRLSRTNERSWLSGRCPKHGRRLSELQEVAGRGVAVVGNAPERKSQELAGDLAGSQLMRVVDGGLAGAGIAGEGGRGSFFFAAITIRPKHTLMCVFEWVETAAHEKGMEAGWRSCRAGGGRP